MTKEFFIFNPLLNTFWLLLILVIITIFLLVLEWFKPRRFIVYRLLAVSVAMLSIGLLMLRPSYLTGGKSDQYLVLTPNYQKQLIDSVLEAHPELTVLNYGDSSTRKSSEKIQTRQQVKMLDGKIAFIAGEGLSKSHFNLLQHKTFHYLPGQKPIGIIEFLHPSLTYPGQLSVIKGKLNVEEFTILQLIDPAGKIDSLILNYPGEHYFTFQVLPKQAGKVLYTLKTITSSNEETVHVPLIISEPQKLEVLMLQLAPSFEMRQLKNFLTGQGHGIQVRSQLSKSNFSYEKVNTELKQITSINNATLKNYDLLILENSTLEQLSRNEAEAITGATKAGLGVLLLMDQVGNKNKQANLISRIALLKDDQDTIHLSFYESSKKHILKKQRLIINPEQDIVPVLASNDKVLSAYHHQGFGKVAMQLLNETYQLRLSGDSTAYAAIWTDLISKSSRIKSIKTEITIADQFPYYPGVPLTFNMLSNEERPQLYYENQIVPITEDLLIDNQWSATMRPQKVGWNSVQLSDSTQYDFYVFDEHEWSALRLQQQMNMHQAEVIEQHEGDYESIHRYKTVPVYYFYLIFVLAMGFLWLVPKL
jgi:hypothetical protein